MVQVVASLMMVMAKGLVVVVVLVGNDENVLFLIVGPLVIVVPLLIAGPGRPHRGPPRTAPKGIRRSYKEFSENPQGRKL